MIDYAEVRELVKDLHFHQGRSIDEKSVAAAWWGELSEPAREIDDIVGLSKLAVLSPLNSQNVTTEFKKKSVCSGQEVHIHDGFDGVTFNVRKKRILNSRPTIVTIDRATDIKDSSESGITINQKIGHINRRLSRIRSHLEPGIIDLHRDTEKVLNHLVKKRPPTPRSKPRWLNIDTYAQDPDAPEFETEDEVLSSFSDLSTANRSIANRSIANRSIANRSRSNRSSANKISIVKPVRIRTCSSDRWSTDNVDPVKLTNSIAGESNRIRLPETQNRRRPSLLNHSLQKQLSPLHEKDYQKREEPRNLEELLYTSQIHERIALPHDIQMNDNKYVYRGDIKEHRSGRFANYESSIDRRIPSVNHDMGFKPNRHLNEYRDPIEEDVRGMIRLQRFISDEISSESGKSRIQYPTASENMADQLQMLENRSRELDYEKECFQRSKLKSEHTTNTRKSSKSQHPENSFGVVGTMNSSNDRLQSNVKQADQPLQNYKRSFRRFIRALSDNELRSRVTAFN